MFEFRVLPLFDAPKSEGFAIIGARPDFDRFILVAAIVLAFPLSACAGAATEPAPTAGPVASENPLPTAGTGVVGRIDHRMAEEFDEAGPDLCGGDSR